MYDGFSGIKFWSSERNTENPMSHLYFDEESDYFKENTCENEENGNHGMKLNIFTPQA